LTQHIRSEFNNTFLLLAKVFLLFLGMIEIYRTIFFVYYYDKLLATENILHELTATYWHALALDAAISSYFLIVPWVLILFYSLMRLKFFKYLLKTYIFIIILLSSFIYVAELGIYNEWEEKPNYKVFMYLDHPDEIINSNPWLYTLILTLILITALVFMYKTMHKVLHNTMMPTPKNYFVSALFFILMPGIILIGIRGGTSSSVITQGDAYFSTQKFYNDASVNTIFNLVKTSIKAQDVLNGHNQFSVQLPLSEKEHYLRPLLKTNDNCNSEMILTSQKPNVVLVILESWSGDFIKGEQKYAQVIPNFMRLSKEGILFTNTYGSGALSHEGIPAVLSGWPDLFGTDISQFPSKSSKIPTITQSLMKHGYQESLFIYGGQLRYGNLTSYIYNNNFTNVEEYKTIKAIQDPKANGRLGYHDGYLLPYFSQKMSKLQTPFFASLFTLSSHSPYDQPMKPVVTWGESDKDFLNSIYYSDRSIGEFIAIAKKEDWYKDTLFIFVADHSHHTPYGWSRNNPKWHHIPMLFYGDVIQQKYRGTVVDKISSQHDIAATLLQQLSIPHDDYLFSRDLFCESYQPSAYYSTNNGYGLITPQGDYAYNAVEKRVQMNDTNSSSTLKLQGALYLEYLIKIFIDL